MYRLATKRTEKNESKKTRKFFFETANQACTGCVTFCYSLLFTKLLNFVLSRSMVTLEKIEFECVHKRYPLNRIVRIPAIRRPKLVTETGLFRQ